MASVRAVRGSPLVGKTLRLRLGFEVGEVEAPPARIAKVYDADTYQRGTDQFALVVFEPPAIIRKPIAKGLFSSKFQEIKVERLFLRVLQGKLEEQPRDAAGNVFRIPFRASLEQLLLGAEPRLKEVQGFAGVPKTPGLTDPEIFDDNRDIAPFAEAVALRP